MSLIKVVQTTFIRSLFLLVKRLPKFLRRSVCVYYCRTYYKAVHGGGRRREEDMCYDIRRAEACVDESAHHALVVGMMTRMINLR